MDILPNEVESVETLGKLFDDDVKMVKTLGGFFLAVGKKNKNSKKAEALAAGSHPAIVGHQLYKDFGSDFQPIVAKSEHDRKPDVEEKTHYLPSDSIKNGLQLFALSKGNDMEFVLYKYGITLGKYTAEAIGNSLTIKDKYFKKSMQADKEIAVAISRAMKDKAYEYNLSKIEEDCSS